MKIVSKPYQTEEANYFCDKHPDRECYNQIKSMCWYGSKFDCFNLEAHLCDECMEDFHKYMKNSFNVEPKETSI